MGGIHGVTQFQYVGGAPEICSGVPDLLVDVGTIDVSNNEYF